MKGKALVEAYEGATWCQSRNLFHSFSLKDRPEICGEKDWKKEPFPQGPVIPKDRWVAQMDMVSNSDDMGLLW